MGGFNRLAVDLQTAYALDCLTALGRSVWAGQGLVGQCLTLSDRCVIISHVSAADPGWGPASMCVSLIVGENQYMPA